MPVDRSSTGAAKLAELGLKATAIAPQKAQLEIATHPARPQLLTQLTRDITKLHFQLIGHHRDVKRPQTAPTFCRES